MQDVSASLDMLGRLVGNHPHAWIKLGNAESALLGDELTEVPVQAPVFISGLARSGSTLLLEILAAERSVVSHRYSDFPFLFTPYWWNAALKINPFRDRAKRERSHGDRMLVNADSPEAMDEMLWMAFFPNRHDAGTNQLLDASVSNPAFEHFYRDHIKKLVLVRKGSRFVSKGNYQLTRMAYLQKLFPDARFIIPVREPASHIASLMRQHRRASEAGRRDPRVVRHMDIAGHFEFGLHRTPINIGDTTREIQAAWASGEEVRGWALYWDMLYGFVHRQLEANPALKQAAMIVRFEDMCAAPREVMGRVLAHSRLPQDGRFATPISAPDYYASPFTPGELQLIRDITHSTASLYGY